jgi:hypothetical protein
MRESSSEFLANFIAVDHRTDGKDVWDLRSAEKIGDIASSFRIEASCSNCGNTSTQLSTCTAITTSTTPCSTTDGANKKLESLVADIDMAAVLKSVEAQLGGQKLGA